MVLICSNFDFSGNAEDSYGKNDDFRNAKMKVLGTKKQEVKNQNHAKNTHWSSDSSLLF
jgi:hypothetical protein